MEENFKHGDKVKVLRTFTDFEKNYQVIWYPSMDCFLEEGIIATVLWKTIYNNFVLEHPNGKNFSFPPFVLEKVNEKPSHEYSYLDSHNKSGLKVGDKVKVFRSCESREGGWSNSWNEEMDKYVGKTGIINKNCKDGGFELVFKNDSFCYVFPYFVLEKVEESLFKDFITAKFLHNDLWNWLADNPEKERRDWPGWDEFPPNYGTYCPACEYIDMDCSKCPIDWRLVGGNRKNCVQSIYNIWINTKESYTRVKIARTIANLPWTKR